MAPSPLLPVSREPAVEGAVKPQPVGYFCLVFGDPFKTISQIFANGGIINMWVKGTDFKCIV